jgi:outer membrane protein insertion porin family
VIFRIHEGPKQRVVWRSFEGNNAFSSGLLKTKLVTDSAFLGFYGGKFDPAKLSDDVEAIRQYYTNHGYFNVDIKHQVAYSDNRARITVTYVIQEGPRAKIRDVKVDGNAVIPKESIQKDIKIKAGEHFNAWTINKDVASIKSKYDQLGRLYASVNAVPRFLEEDPGTCDLIYVIDEDKPYTIRRVDVQIAGDNPHTKRSVARNYLQIYPGDPASREAIEKSKRRLDGSQAFKAGVTKAVIKKVDPNEYGDGRGDIRPVRGQSTEGQNSDEASAAPGAPRPDFGRASNERRGQRAFAAAAPPRRVAYGPRDDEREHDPTIFDFANDAPPDFVVVRAQGVDDPFATPANPMFDNSPQGDPYGNIMRTPQGQVDVLIQPEEERTGRLMFGVGVNSDAGVVGSIVLSEQNFDIMRPPRSWQDIINGEAWRGGGQRFRAEAVPGSVVSRYMLSWSDPYFMDTDYSVGVSGFFFNRFYPDWDEERLGGRISLGKQLTPVLSVNAALRLENVDISDPDTPTPSALADAVGTSFLSTARFSVIHDTRDSAYLPSMGHKVELAYEQAFGDFTYPRFDAEGRQHFTLYNRPDGGGRHTLTVGGNLGWTGNDTPIFERFFAGGFQTFRGFAFRGVSPREFGVRVGGEWMAIGSVEYMIPLVASDMMHAVVFSDFGTVEEDVSFSDFRVTAGAGLRVTVPAMGPVPLAFDFAFPIVSQNFDDEQVFSFYVGLTR